MNQIAAQQDNSKLIATLQSSLYVGAKTESVEMVISYCQAAGLDVMQKPVHIVPMSVKNAQTGAYEWRDVIMPGIGLYRIQADRSGTLAGISSPEFGPDITQSFTDKNGKTSEFTFPEWCTISMQKLVGDHIVEFTAKEYWLENYATDSSKSDAPNSMWRKRKRGQLVKCTEAQVLRKGWPETGQAPTAEEMEGKTIDMGSAERVDTSAKKITETELMPEYPEHKFNANFPLWEKMIKSGKKPVGDVIATVQSLNKLTQHQIDRLMDITIDRPTQEVTDAEFLAAYDNEEKNQ